MMLHSPSNSKTHIKLNISLANKSTYAVSAITRIDNLRSTCEASTALLFKIAYYAQHITDIFQAGAFMY
jgi:hypothetical protein